MGRTEGEVWAWTGGWVNQRSEGGAWLILLWAGQG